MTFNSSTAAVATVALLFASLNGVDQNYAYGRSEAPVRERPTVCGPVDTAAFDPHAEEDTAIASGSQAIVVTGTRIQRQHFESTSPITTVDTAMLAPPPAPARRTAVAPQPQMAPPTGAARIAVAQEPQFIPPPTYQGRDRFTSWSRSMPDAPGIRMSVTTTSKVCSWSTPRASFPSFASVTL